MDGMLTLMLKYKWYDMIKSGEKKTEYRRICPLYTRELSKDPQYVTFHRGYTNTHMTFVIKGYHIGEGREDWGAEKDVEYYCIELGRRVL